MTSRRATRTSEALALFRELEATPPRRRGQAYEDKAHELARKLGLVAEWWTCNSVLDRGGPCHQEGGGYIANDDHRRCRAVRNELLAALDR
jgi:hypothetical protein